MKYLLAISICCIVASASAQKYKAGISFSPDFAYRVKTSKTGSLPYDEVPKLGYTFTAGFERVLNKNFSFFTGLLFVNGGYQTERLDLLYSDQISGGQGTQTPPTEDRYSAARFRYNYFQIGLPIGVNYSTPINKRIKFFAGGGISINSLVSIWQTGILYGANGTANNATRRSYAVGNINRFNVSVLAHAGIEMKLKEKYTLRLFTDYNYTATNMLPGESIYTLRLYNTGLGVGVYKSF